jgi:hypothetical protein
MLGGEGGWAIRGPTRTRLERPPVSRSHPEGWNGPSGAARAPQLARSKSQFPGGVRRAKHLGGYQDWAAGKECPTRHPREAVLSSLHVPNPIALGRLGGRLWRCCAVGHSAVRPSRRIGKDCILANMSKDRVTFAHTSRGVGKSRAPHAGQAPSQGGRRSGARGSWAQIVRAQSNVPGRICHQFVDWHVGNVGALL